ncbi:MAG: GNAT family N-acetyltransferase [Nakamurella sp.]
MVPTPGAGIGVTFRPREPADLPMLVTLLAAQQPRSHYPFRWPLPFPPEQFIARETERHSWVAVVDGTMAGHVAVTSVDDDDFGRVWSAGTGLERTELGCVSSFFVDETRRGLGIGGGLLDRAVAIVRAEGRLPVLDVVQRHGGALAMYRHRGWREVGEVRPPWLPDDEPPVVAMVLDDPTGDPTTPQ